ncbi:hypothetical protein BKA60DRAFT_640752 [Fusarium oxysporum]|nr:hypothetical protein BKA60DRAFT_640752 [Fusarium oxysporum]
MPYDPNSRIANVARVQGWGHGGFGAYVHRFVQNEMAAVDGTQDGQHHFFYVWHPDSDWYPAFEGRQAEDLLGPAFGGYHHDLATICLRMRADRELLSKRPIMGVSPCSILLFQPTTRS